MSTKGKVVPFHHWILLLSTLVILIAIPNFQISRTLLFANPNVFRRSELRFAVPPSWRKVDKQVDSPLPLTYREHDNRLFVSAIGTDNSDGLGHRFLMINYDVNVAYALGVGYLHRRARYGSLTPDHDPLTVERLFGWENYPDIRDDFLYRECEVEHVSGFCSRGESIIAPICKTLKPHSNFNHIVRIPTDYTDCIFQRDYDRLKCINQLRQFGKTHNETGTIFQMTPTMCPSSYRDGLFNYTSDWFLKKYWDYHRTNTTLGFDMDTSSTRVLPFNESRIQVAVHIRRGDFAYFTHRHQVPDWAYANIIADCKRIADFIFGRPVGMDVAFFSEGVPKKGGIMIARHNVSRMDPIYVTESGEQIDDAAQHFKSLIMKNLSGIDQSQIRLTAYIATDTLAAIHTMNCADIFIGSSSAMSLHIVKLLARGIVFLPETKFKKSQPYSLQLRFDDSSPNESTLVSRSGLKIAMRKMFSKELADETILQA